MVFVVFAMSVRLGVGEIVVRIVRVVGGCTSSSPYFAHFLIDFGHRRPNSWK
jgi:hypothetical protein